MGRLSTHVLDTTSGMPAAGVKIALLRANGSSWAGIKSVVTNNDGRTDEPLLTGSEFSAGVYRLEFHIADYFRNAGAKLTDPPLFDIVPIQIGVADASLHYHVPLLCSPWAYNTYRGS
jgi:5-hydroxyisourate hydrolase